MDRATIPYRDLQLPSGEGLWWDVDASEQQQRAQRVGTGSLSPLAVYRTAKCMLVLAAVEETPHGALLHICISYRDRYPSWREIKAVKDLFYGPCRDAMMVLPKAKDYVAVHPNCFHLWEMPVGWGIQ